MEPIRLICMRADSPLAARGSNFDHQCCKCGVALMVAPTGIRAMRQAVADGVSVETACLSCALKSNPDLLNDIRLAAPREDVIGEMKTVVPNMRRYRN